MRSRASFDVLQVPTDPLKPDDCQDAAEIDMANGIAIVADGASLSFDARRWARTLSAVAVDIADSDPKDIVTTWSTAMRDWTLHRDQPVFPPGIDVKTSASTLAVLTVRPPRWQFVAVGDVNLVLRRSDGTVLIRPSLSDGSKYGTTPSVLHDSPFPAVANYTDGFCGAGDLFLCFTDGIGQWLVDHLDHATLRAVASMGQSEFAEFVDRCRAEGGLISDDATLVRCSVQR